MDAVTTGYPAYYMVNCAHPEHFQSALEEGRPWMQRLRGVRANASRMAHSELDGAVALDDGEPAELGRIIAAMRARHPGLTILGGCCGTDARHIGAIAQACKPLFTGLLN